MTAIREMLNVVTIVTGALSCSGFVLPRSDRLAGLECSSQLLQETEHFCWERQEKVAKIVPSAPPLKLANNRPAPRQVLLFAIRQSAPSLSREPRLIRQTRRHPSGWLYETPIRISTTGSTSAIEHGPESRKQRPELPPVLRRKAIQGTKERTVPARHSTG
jgi:hypothetical protein